MTEDQADISIPSPNKPVKRHKRGDVREDGKVFCYYYQKSKERWVDPDVFAQIQEKLRQYRKLNEAKINKSRQEWLQRNPEKAKQVAKNWRTRNPDKIKKKNEAWLLLNKERKKQTNKEWVKANKQRKQENDRKWRQDNLVSERKRAREYVRKKRVADPIYGTASRMRSRLRKALRTSKKEEKADKILGISFSDFWGYLQALFLPGMSWEGRSLWHIDHIVPIAAGRTEEEIYLLSHYTNLRPLWGYENISKGDRLPDELPSTIHPEVRAIWLREKQHTNP